MSNVPLDSLTGLIQLEDEPNLDFLNAPVVVEDDGIVLNLSDGELAQINAEIDSDEDEVRDIIMGGRSSGLHRSQRIDFDEFEREELNEVYEMLMNEQREERRISEALSRARLEFRNLRRARHARNQVVRDRQARARQEVQDARQALSDRHSEATNFDSPIGIHIRTKEDKKKQKTEL